MQISISHEIEEFAGFIEDRTNTKIIFSGKFGIGKTYFLNEFFENKSDKYIPIFINPVNYSVASNEDIFELIKADIMMSLIDINAPMLKNDVSFTAAVADMCKNDTKEFFKSLVGVFKPLHKSVEVIKGAIEFFEAVVKHQEELQKDETKLADQYLGDIFNEAGGIYEFDKISLLIYKLLERWRSSNLKQFVLIIDDMDRLDPEHIFRILNILSAHQDYRNENENKFGFDKTILVCDIENIREIFQYKYGERVDFNGFIDKFYSREIYNFENTRQIIEAAEDTIMGICVKQDHAYYKMERTNYVTQLIVALLKTLIRNHRINIRSLIKLENKTFFFRTQFLLNKETQYSYFVPGIVIMELFRGLFGSEEDMNKAFRNLTLHEEDWRDCHQYAYIFLIPLAGINSTLLKIGEQFEYSYKDGIDAWQYHLSRYRDDRMVVAETEDMNLAQYQDLGHISQIITEACNSYIGLHFL